MMDQPHVLAYPCTLIDCQMQLGVQCETDKLQYIGLDVKMISQSLLFVPVHKVVLYLRSR